MCMCTCMHVDLVHACVNVLVSITAVAVHGGAQVPSVGKRGLAWSGQVNCQRQGKTFVKGCSC